MIKVGARDDNFPEFGCSWKVVLDAIIIVDEYLLHKFKLAMLLKIHE